MNPVPDKKSMAGLLILLNKSMVAFLFVNVIFRFMSSMTDSLITFSTYLREHSATASKSSDTLAGIKMAFVGGGSVVLVVVSAATVAVGGGPVVLVVVSVATAAVVGASVVVESIKSAVALAEVAACVVASAVVIASAVAVASATVVASVKLPLSNDRRNRSPSVFGAIVDVKLVTWS